MRSPSYLRLFIAFQFLFFLGSQEFSVQAAERPNILWLTSEDNGPQLGCYGDAYADTPNLDRLAAKGMKYLNCWSNAPVCAPARTTIISGIYPPATGSQHMRSQTRLPDEFKMYPAMLRAAGYYCTNNSKEDYNLVTPKNLWDESSGKAHWRKRSDGQPFFSVFNITTSHESQLRKRPHTPVHDAAKVNVPPFHPDLPEVRQDWAQYYDKVTEMDGQMGELLKQLDDDGLADETIVFYYGDHGTGMPRGKRWLYQTGLHVPLIVYVPAKFERLAGPHYHAKSDNSELAGFVDLYPTLLSLVGESIPDHLQGRALLGPKAVDGPKYMFGFRDRMDERYDLSRTVRDERFAYIRNFLPQRPQGQYLDYMFQTPTTKAWKRAFDDGKLNDAQSSFWKMKPAEELFDLENDPYQIRNLANEPEHQQTMARMRFALRDWMFEIRDLGLLPEADVHRRAGKDAPYTMGHDPSRYPMESIYEVADLATRIHEKDESTELKKLVEAFESKDSAIRYWAANGILWRGLNGQQVSVDPLLSAMTSDSSSIVRSVSAEAVARLGSKPQRTLAINQLLKEADQESHTTFEAMQALNSLAHSAPTAKELDGRIEKLPAKTTNPPPRADGYVGRLLQSF